MVNRIELDALTGEQTITELTSQEIDELESANAANQAAAEAEIASKTAARQSALAKLKALGLTEAEIAAL
jgi:DNA-binding NarL/FixJ family response regulator